MVTIIMTRTVAAMNVQWTTSTKSDVTADRYITLKKRFYKFRL